MHSAVLTRSERSTRNGRCREAIVCGRRPSASRSRVKKALAMLDDRFSERVHARREGGSASQREGSRELRISRLRAQDLDFRFARFSLALALKHEDVTYESPWASAAGPRSKLVRSSRSRARALAEPSQRCKSKRASPNISPRPRSRTRRPARPRRPSRRAKARPRQPPSRCRSADGSCSSARATSPSPVR